MSSLRITTNGLFRNYRTNLYKNNNKLNDAMTKVQTERNFNTYAEDPAAASKAWRLRRSYWLNGDQIDNSNYIISKYESASQAMHAIVDGDAGNGIYGLNGILSAVKGLSDTSGSARNALGKELVQTAQNMVSVMNSKYGEDFVFAGADGANIPFAWDGGKLLYRGLHVSVEQPRSLESFGLTGDVLDKYGLTSRVLGEDYDPAKTNLDSFSMEKPLTAEEFRADGVSKSFEQFASENPTMTEEEQQAGYDALVNSEYAAYRTDYLTRNADGETYNVKVSTFEEAQAIYAKLSAYKEYTGEYSTRNGMGYEKGAEEYGKLQNLADEATYIDIGLGMQEDENGELITGSAFNSSISGLKFLGYGRDQNLAEIVYELGDIFLRADPETGYYENEEVDGPRADELLNKLHEAVGASQRQHVQLEADAKYLNTNLDQLKINKDQLNTQINDTERMDMADAITQMTWAKYCYDAALRIGTNILSQSLLDYMG